MSSPTSHDRPEKAFEADDINPEIVAAIDEIQGRRKLELEAQSAKSDMERARRTRLFALAVAAAVAALAAVYAFA
ncbi:MAG: hypothetical protein ACT4OU_06210 [Hyphomicrobium sp.]